MRYQVEYIKNGQHLFEEIEGCKDAGMAFARCQKLHPGCPMFHCIAFSGKAGFEAKMNHEPPPVQRAAHRVSGLGACRPPKRDDRDGVMPFYDEVETHRVWDSGKLVAAPSVRATMPNS